MKYEIGARIRAFREARGLTQKELADRLQINNNRVSNWEQGINRPDADMLADICRVLQVSPSELLNIRLTDEEFSSRERALIRAYREHPEMQNAVDVLLGLKDIT
ncbi:MAG: helix-turn-helix domain-containing protein [Firmicutes bacterium]|nr:helix-turn-helix domain-containing protein [Bacillota bacterium]